MSVDLTSVLADLMRREPLFHRPELGTSRDDFENMTVPDFWEVGASGRCYTREYVLAELAKRYSGPYEDVWQTSDFACRELAPDVYLLTYELLQNRTRRTRRTTIWQRTPSGWKAVYHQGTLIS